ncbi:MAG: hypothetical protein Q8O89_07790 [Nanoarchaeota archaeon]|nr:hypothetical protein [Nanoarchaeota archaeon]
MLKNEVCLIIILLIFISGCSDSPPAKDITYRAEDTNISEDNINTGQLQKDNLAQPEINPEEEAAEEQCLDEDDDGYCDNVISDWRENYNIACPQELLKQNYSFPGASGLGSAYFPLNGFSGEKGAVYCPKGTKAGQNVNYHYCGNAVYEAPASTDSEGNILSESRKIVFAAVVKELQPADASKPLELMEMKCYEYAPEILEEDCADENNDLICDSEQNIKKYLKESDDIPCPQELLKQNYSFPGASGLGSAYFPLNGFSGEKGAVYCPIGSKAGQNVNYHYCAPFIFDTFSITDSSGKILDETKKIFGKATVKELPYHSADLSGSKPGELIELKCYESYYEYEVIEPTPQTQTGKTTNTGSANSCGYGNCLSNGICCPSYARYYCEGYCYASSSKALSASQGRCVNFRIVC